jgi:hypothetical protein
MSRLMTILGIVFLALGAAIAVVGFVRPGQMQISGLTMDSAGLLLMTGLMGLGFGGIIDAIQNRGGAKSMAAIEATTAEPVVAKKVEAAAPVMVAATPAPVVAAEEQQTSRIRFRGFGSKPGTETAGVAAAVTAVAATTVTPAKSSVDDTINALEKAKQDITSALGGVERISTATPPPIIVKAPEPEVEEETLIEEETSPSDDGELYVVEEKMIRGRPTRILSDDTVEAETDEGWMRFENLEHLNEYLDAAEA